MIDGSWARSSSVGRALARWVYAAAFVAVSASVAHPAHGDEPTERDINAARSLADAGFERFSAGSYAEAFDRFQSAEALFHAPPHVLFMARSKVKLGELIAARDIYRGLVQETLPEGSPEAFAEAQGEARRELTELEARLPKLTITVVGAPEGSATVTVDGAPVSLTESPLVLDAGDHRVVASAQGFPDASQTVTLAEGASVTVTLPLTATAQSGPGPDDTADEPPREKNIVPPAVVMGVGGVGLVVGAITGIVAMGKASDLDTACPDRARCPAENESLEDSARTFGTVSTISFVAGGLCVAGGAAWLIYELTKDGGDDASAFVRPVIHNGEVGVGWSF